MEDYASEVRSRVGVLGHGHPFVDGVRDVKSKVEVLRQHVHDSVMRFHDEIVARRHRLADRLREYEEGSLHFSLDCAKLSLGESGGPDACVTAEGCDWCSSDRLDMLHIQGFCAASADGDALRGWGMTCGGAESDGAWDFVEEEEKEITDVEEIMKENEVMDVMDTASSELVESSEAGNIADMLMVSELAFEQPENEAEVEAILAQEAEERGENVDFEPETADAGNLLELEEEDVEALLEEDKYCLERTSVEDCDAGADEDGRPCVWCKYNSWLGTCVTTKDKDVVTGEFAMTCADNEMK